MKKKTKEIMDWYQGPLRKKRVAELRYKLAVARGFISHLQTVLKGIPLPETIQLSTQDGDFNFDLEAIEKILKETSDP